MEIWSPRFICILIYFLLCHLGDGGAQETVFPNPQDVFALDPSFDVPVYNVTVTAGKTAILPCTIENLGGHKVVWTDRFSTLLTYDIGRIIDDDRIGVERPFTDDWNLLIHDVRYSDSGKYVCQINTKPVRTQTVMLHVLVPPKIDEELSTGNIITREGETVTLTCNVSGIPPPVVHWYRRPLDQAIGKAKERVGINGEFLIIHNISRYCDGIYECVAFNDVPPAVNKDIKVEVEFPPEIRLQNRRIGQAPGRETILECQISAFPMNFLVWKYRDQPLKTSMKHRIEMYTDGNHRVTLSLRVMDIRPSDYGNYTCFAKNLLGEDSEVMLLYDHTIPHTPKITTTTTTRKPYVWTTHHTKWIEEDKKKPLLDGDDKETSAMRGGAPDCSYKNSVSMFYVMLNIFVLLIVS